MGTVIDNHPAMADGMNENGLACAGLNFAGYAYFEDKPVPGKINIAPYDFIHWVLSNHDTVSEVKDAIKNLELVNIPINNQTPIATLHWMIVDKTGKSIVVEKTKDNNRINAIDINKEKSTNNTLKIFPYVTKQDINYQN